MAVFEQDQRSSPENLLDQAESLLTQAQAHMADIQRALDAMSGDDGLRSRLTDVAAQISGAIGALYQALSGPVSALRRTDLLALQGIVQSALITGLLTQASAQAGASGRVETLAAASAAVRTETQTLADDIFGRRMFAPYLRFESAEEEAAFRDREARARAYIEAQLGRGTQEGNLNAGSGMLGHMLDAHAHGAGDSPDFLPRWNSLADKLQRQRAAMRAAGQSTEECDRNLATSARQYLKEKARLSDAEIDARLDGAASPLEAVKPFIRQDHAARKMEKTAAIIVETVRPNPEDFPRIERMAATATSTAALTIDPETMHARLKAAGILTDNITEQVSGHGLTAQKPVGRPRSGPAG